MERTELQIEPRKTHADKCFLCTCFRDEGAILKTNQNGQKVNVLEVKATL